MFRLTKNNDNTWDIVPMEGKFAGQSVGKAERLALENAQFDGRAILAAIKAVWGLQLYGDLDARLARALCIGKVFHERPGMKVSACSQGFLRRDLATYVRGAKEVSLNLNDVFVRGAY